MKKFINNTQSEDIDIFAIAIGNKIGKDKFCKFTGFPTKNLEVVFDNKIHQELRVSKGVDIGLGGWINMLIMLSGINSFKTIREVIRGYTGDRNSKQIFSDEDQINLLNLIKFSGVFFKYTWQAAPSSIALAYHVAHTHQESPSFKPGNPNSG